MEEKSVLKLYLALLDDDIEREIISSISQGLENHEILLKLLPFIERKVEEC